jgi:hypothetical protein
MLLKKRIPLKKKSLVGLVDTFDIVHQDKDDGHLLPIALAL